MPDDAGRCRLAAVAARSWRCSVLLANLPGWRCLAGAAGRQPCGACQQGAVLPAMPADALLSTFRPRHSSARCCAAGPGGGEAGGAGHLGPVHGLPRGGHQGHQLHRRGLALPAGGWAASRGRARLSQCAGSTCLARRAKRRAVCWSTILTRAPCGPARLLPCPQWTGGSYTAFMMPGAWTSLRDAYFKPCGRIHWWVG